MGKSDGVGGEGWKKERNGRIIIRNQDRGIGGIITQSSVSFDLSATKLQVGDWVKIPRVLPPPVLALLQGVDYEKKRE